MRLVVGSSHLKEQVYCFFCGKSGWSFEVAIEDAKPGLYYAVCSGCRKKEV